MCHTVNEVLEFHKAVCEVHGYPAHLPSCLNVFTQTEDYFSSWIGVELKCKKKYILAHIFLNFPLLPPPPPNNIVAREYFNDMMQEANQPWGLLYSSMDEVETDENLRPTNSAHSLITLLSNVTGTYSEISSS